MENFKGEIIYVGDMADGSNSRARHDVLAGLCSSIRAVPELSFYRRPRQGRLVRFLGLTLGGGREIRRANEHMIRLSDSLKPSVMWIDKGDWIQPRTLVKLKERGVILVHHTSDSIYPRNWKLWCTRRLLRQGMPHYDVVFTAIPRDYAVIRRSLGRRVRLVLLGYDAKRFATPSPWKFGERPFDVAFVGHAEPKYVHYIKALRNTGVKLKISGGREWLEQVGSAGNIKYGPAVYGKEYAATLGSARVCLGFLSEWNYNKSTTRTFEIPAAHSVLLAERTSQHRMLFREGHEALFFSSAREMKMHIDRLKDDQEAAEALAEGGHGRLLSSGYSKCKIWRNQWEWFDESFRGIKRCKS